MLSHEQIEAHGERVERDGYSVIENAIEPELIDAIAADLDRLERKYDIKPANNQFEGGKTVRIYNLLVFGELYERIPVHENILPVVEKVLDPGCLISSLSSIAICAEERSQPIHADDQLIPLPRPHPPLVCNTMWAITDFTAENGATRLVPGSHKLDHAPDYGKRIETIPAVMSKGSALIWNGSLWHGGGSNKTAERRIGIAMNYCAGYIRQQENQQLGIPRDIAQRFSPRLRELVGYSVYNGLIGHINKRNPVGLLDGGGEQHMVWDI